VAFATMLRERVAPALREMGFRGSAQNYALPSETHWALLGFQRSMHSDRNTLRFTLNMTVVRRDAWANAYAERAWIGRQPSALVSYAPRDGVSGYWHVRVGSLLPQRRDHWWDLDAEGETDKTATEVVAAIRDYVLPAMREHMV
jgi:uncharacterized protein DUF4304